MTGQRTRFIAAMAASSSWRRPAAGAGGVVLEAEGAGELGGGRLVRVGEARRRRARARTGRHVVDLGGPAGHASSVLLVGVPCAQHVEAVRVVVGLQQRESAASVFTASRTPATTQRQPVRAEIDVRDVDRDRHARVERALVVDHPGQSVVDR